MLRPGLLTDGGSIIRPLSQIGVLRGAYFYFLDDISKFRKTRIRVRAQQSVGRI